MFIPAQWAWGSFFLSLGLSGWGTVCGAPTRTAVEHSGGGAGGPTGSQSCRQETMSVSSALCLSFFWKGCGLPSWSFPRGASQSGFPQQGFLAPDVIDAKTPGAWKAVRTCQRSLSTHCPWEGELSCPHCAMLSHHW